MKFLVGNITVAVTGATTTQKVLADILHYVHTDTDSTDVEFEFMRQLPDWDESGYALTDDFLATPDRFRAVDKLWRYDGQMDGTPVKISVVARSQGAAKQFRHAIKETWRYFHIYGRGAYLHKARRFIFYVYLPLVQLMLLTKRSTFAHCSAIERDGKVVLFSALGGVGKTSIMSKYIQEGWRFLSDDLCIITEDGTASIHPLPMHIYKYHQVSNPELVERMLRQASAWDRVLWRVLGKFKKPTRLVRWVDPERIFGAERMARQGKISASIQLRRCDDIDSITCRGMDAAEIASLMANTILHELSNLPRMSVAINSICPVKCVPDIDRMYATICQVYEAALHDAACYVLDVPSRTSTDEIKAFLDEQGLVRID